MKTAAPQTPPASAATLDAGPNDAGAIAPGTNATAPAALAAAAPEASPAARLQELGLLVVIVLLCLLLYAASDPVTVRGRTLNNFWRLDNLLPNVLTPLSMTAIMAVGVTFVIVAGGIDISIGSIFGLSALATAAVLQQYPVAAAPWPDYARLGRDLSHLHWPPGEAWGVYVSMVAAALGVGLACGLVNGALVVGLRMHPFIVTLGTLSIFRGIALVSVKEKSLPSGGRDLPTALTDYFVALRSKGAWLAAADRYVRPGSLAILCGLIGAWALAGLVRLPGRPDATRFWRQSIRGALLAAAALALWLRAGVGEPGRGELIVQVVPILVMLAVGAAAWVYLSHTAAGRENYAVGGNEEAARFSGLAVGRIKLRVYALSGLLAGVAGLVSVGFYGAATTGTGEGYELMVIAAAVVGGASLTGGRGTALGALLGALVIKLIENGIAIVKFIHLGFIKLPLSKEYTKIIIGIAIILAVAIDRLSETLQRRRMARRKPGG